MRNIGYLYDRGYGVPQDYAKAREWYEKAAAGGDAAAMSNIGALYDVGHGAPQDYAKAREWYEKAAAGGDVLAMRNIGYLHDVGHGVPQDYAKAREWYEKAAAAGDATAMNNIGALYDEGHGLPQDYAKAREWYEKAAAAGDATAMSNIGYLYDNGHGVPQDYVKAREWYEKAVAAGDADASGALAAIVWKPERAAINEASAAGRYVDALQLHERLAQEIEADEARIAGKPGARTASELGGVSWDALFAREFPRALAAAERAHSLAPDALWIETNHAHALMFLDRVADARALYLSHRDEPIPESDNRPWRQVVAEDFVEFRKADLVRPMMDEIEAALAPGKPP